MVSDHLAARPAVRSPFLGVIAIVFSYFRFESAVILLAGLAERFQFRVGWEGFGFENEPKKFSAKFAC